MENMGLATYGLGLLASAAAGYMLGKMQPAAKEAEEKSEGKLSVTPGDIDQGKVTPEDLKRLIPGSQAADSDSEEPGKIIIVGYRLPVSITRNENGEFIVRGADERNFLANMRVLAQSGREVVFVGTPPISISRSEEDELEAVLEDIDGIALIPVFLDRDVQNRFYKVFCKTVLWPILHYVTPQGREDLGERWESAWNGYVSGNIQFARTVAGVSESAQDLIWIQNYHLLMVPAFLRHKLPRAKIGMFCHTPFPSSDVFRMLPAAEQILRGMMCSDLIGFHTFDHARHFLSSVKRLLDCPYQNLPGGAMGIKYSGRDVSVVINHVGIEPEAFQRVCDMKETRAAVEDLKRQFKGRKIVLGVDDLDLVKASVLKLKAYKRFLDNHPEMKEQVVLVQVLLPSSACEEDKKFVNRVCQREIASIKETHGEESIHVIEGKSFNMQEYVALNRASNVAVISVFWDGLNLGPYEYTACQDNSNPGSLIISEFMGCSRSLSGVIRINPWNLDQVAESIYDALHLPEDIRITSHRRRHRYVLHRTTSTWATSFLKSLDTACHQSDDLAFVQVGWGSSVRLVGLRSDFAHLEESVVLPAYKKAANRIMLFDYDGTLHTSSKNGQNAPSTELIQWLKHLSEHQGNRVFIISGRTRVQLQKWFGDLPELGLAAEKGCFIRWPASIVDQCQSSVHDMQDNDAQDDEPLDEKLAGDFKDWEIMKHIPSSAWKPICMDILKEYTRHTDGSWIEPKELGITWHFDSADPDYGTMQSAELAKYINEVNPNPQIMAHRSNNSNTVEVKPVGVGKGVTVVHILGQLLQMHENPSPFCLIIGDDKADEEMFIGANHILAPRLRGVAPKHDPSLFDERQEDSNAKRHERKVSIPNLFTTCVGIKPSNAKYYVHDDDQVRSIVQSMAQWSDVRMRAESRDADMFKKTQ